MYIDWITWSIWFLGLIILMVWIYVPIKEFKTLLEKHRKKQHQADESGTAGR